MSSPVEPAPKRRKTNEVPQAAAGSLSREVQMGIGAWLSRSLVPIRGGFKTRITDFVVNEIDPDGNVVELTDWQTLPLDPQPSGLPVSWVDVVEKLRLPESVTADIVALSRSAPPSKASVTVDVATLDKESRRSLHQSIRQFWPGLSSTTVDSAVVISKGNANSRSGGGYSWPEGRPKFLSAVLRKRNRDTTDVVHELSSILRVKPSVFSFAGTKDKRGVTTQRLTGWKVVAERLRGLSGKLKGIEFGNFVYVSDQLGLGDLSGNRFSVVLRNIALIDSLENTQSVLFNSCSAVSATGFINYFGLQRFGTSDIATHLVGIALLKDDWKHAVDLIMMPRSGESDDVQRARAAFVAAPSAVDLHLDAFPKKLTIERMILESLQKHGHTAYLNAVQSLPRPTRLLYLHAYQSYVWNTVATERVRIGPLVPIAGDLVLLGAETAHILRDDADIRARGSTFADVVLPLPGHSVVYPANWLVDVYTRTMAEAGLSLQSFERKISDFSLPGGYRAIIQKPGALEWYARTGFACPIF